MGKKDKENTTVQKNPIGPGAGTAAAPESDAPTQLRRGFSILGENTVYVSPPEDLHGYVISTW